MHSNVRNENMTMTALLWFAHLYYSHSLLQHHHKHCAISFCLSVELGRTSSKQEIIVDEIVLASPCVSVQNDQNLSATVSFFQIQQHSGNN